ncbi:MAG: hypothetical protein ACKOEI_06575, partial [Chthoniobacterales bacterium]
MAKNKPSKEPDPGTGSSPLFARPDWVSAAVTAVISGAVYFYTAMPNVGLLVSGELPVPGTGSLEGLFLAIRENRRANTLVPRSASAGCQVTSNPLRAARSFSSFPTLN